MKITGLEVDGYGIWSGLRLDELSEGLNVFFGPNEAGKTTLIEFVRSVLYGFTPQRRRYLPPLHGGRPGGSLQVIGPNGRFQVSRHQNEQDPDAGDEICLSAPDGTRHSGHFLNVLLYNVDESIFNNVFAVGLQELQQLATLDNTEAASLLYSLSAGLDRVALVDVLRELETSRNRILSAHGQASEVTRLLAERERLRAEISELDELTHRYLRLAAEREQLERETTRLEEEANQLRYQARVIEIAASIGDRWERRTELDEQLLALGPLDAIAEGAVDRLDAVTAALERGADRMGRLRQAWDGLRAEAAALKANEALWRLAPRIEALAEQESWISTLQKRSEELETEITDLEAQLSAEQERLGLGKPSETDALPSLSSGSLRTLRGPARELRQCRQRLKEAERQVAAARECAQSLAAQIEAALSAHGQHDLAQAMDQTGGLVAKLRRRVQLDQRLDQMDRHQVELQEQSRQLLQRQVLPVGVLLALGGVFVVSVILILAGLFMPESITGSLGWLLALVGLGGLGAGVAAKFILERSNARRLQGCQEQINMLQLQTKEARQEREALDRHLSIDEALVCARLKAAEEDLAQLEALVPLDARRKTAQQEAETAAARAAEIQSDLDAARRRWQEALHTVGLPTRLSPKQVRELASRSGYVVELQRRLESRYEEYEARRGELEALTGRIVQLASEAGLTVPSSDPIEQIRALVQHLAEEEARLKRREALRTRARQLRRKRTKYQRAIRRLKYRREEILRQAGAKDEHEFRQRAAQAARAEELRRRRESLQREIDAAIAGHCPEEALRAELEGDRGQHLEERYDHLEKRLQAAETKLQERFEKRGTLNEQLKALAENRLPAAKRFELGLVEKRLEEAIHRWRVLAVASRILKTIRTSYEQERQPSTLLEASGYLERITQGRYVRVWTPLDEDILLVDDAQGKPFPIELLSRGSREQLFLCLRLALASSLARRGAPLPLLLDDVLVNFDSRRAKAAVAVLRDFASAGRQVLVFTCHEHISKLFRSLRVQVSELPDHATRDLPTAASPKPAKKRRQRHREPQELPHEVVAESAGRQSGDLLETPSVDHGEQSMATISANHDTAEAVPPRDEPAAWEEEQADAPCAAVAEADDEDQPDDKYHGYYDDQGSFDDHGVQITGEDDREEYEEDENDEPYDEEEEDDEEEDEEPYENDYHDDRDEAEAA